MLQFGRAVVCFHTVLFVCGLVPLVAAQSVNSQKQVERDSYLDDPSNWLEQFVPDSQVFWDNSLNWTTNYGPAYRDTLTKGSQFLACSSQFALCFHSGQYPLPCHLSPDGRSANCTCTVMNGSNYVLMTAILNSPIYLDTLAGLRHGRILVRHDQSGAGLWLPERWCSDPWGGRNVHLRSGLAPRSPGRFSGQEPGDGLFATASAAAFRRLYDRALQAQLRRVHRAMQVSCVLWHVPTDREKCPVFPGR